MKRSLEKTKIDNRRVKLFSRETILTDGSEISLSEIFQAVTERVWEKLFFIHKYDKQT